VGLDRMITGNWGTAHQGQPQAGPNRPVDQLDQDPGRAIHTMACNRTAASGNGATFPTHRSPLDLAIDSFPPASAPITNWSDIAPVTITAWP